MLDTLFDEYLEEAEEFIFFPTQLLNSSPLVDFVAFGEWEQLLLKYPLKKLTLLTNRKFYPMDTDALFTGSLEVLKRCQRKPDIDLSITIQDVKNACKKFNIDVL